MNSSLPALVQRLDAWLPQTQCTRCGYPRCLAYAEAMAAGTADINYCPPGGEVTIHALAGLLGRPARPLDPDRDTCLTRQRAVIDEPVCIGCRKCIDVCPVDAILGARKFMHTVLAGECNGCALCLPACPVDCIQLLSVKVAADPDSPWPEYSRAETGHWRQRTTARLARLARRSETRRQPDVPHASRDERERIRAEIRAAVARVKAKKKQP
jgi:electron transport complex protein RnfB